VNKALNRRSVLKLAGGILATAPFVQAARFAQASSGMGGPNFDAEVLPARRPFGRAIHGNLVVREQPSSTAKAVRQLSFNEVVAVLGQVDSGEAKAYNPIWYKLQDGYIHSGFVQPCDNVTNLAVPLAPSEAFWGEITVPLTEARSAADPNARLRYRYYYGCVFHVIASLADEQGTWWYQISDENAGNGFFARAEQIRRIDAGEFAPISPDVPTEAKRVEIDLAKQLVYAYEGDYQVFTARTATGMSGMRTTPGLHRVIKKTPSRHMTGGAGSGYYDLPGIAWCTYFTSSGIALHATYWHNDYGRPRSHGCVNLLPEDAKWLFRWATPPSPYDQRWTRPNGDSLPSTVKVF